MRLFPYYGSKVKNAKKYPSPKFGTIIEPFAGACGYSCFYCDADVIVSDTNHKVVEVLKYLIAASGDDIINLPLIPPCNSIDFYDLKDAEKWLIGFWLNNGSSSPAKTLSAWGRQAWPNPPANFWGPKCRERLAGDVEKISHWKAFEIGYDALPNHEATWFVDPPYMDAGKHYKHSSINYNHLGDWCKSRMGQVIVCENNGADWLPFVDLYEIKGQGRGRNIRGEVIYISANHPTQEENG